MMTMDNETRAQLHTLPGGHPIKATVNNGGRLMVSKRLVKDGAHSWYAIGGGFYDVDLLSDALIPEVVWPPDPLPTVPATVIIGDLYADNPNRPTVYSAHLMRSTVRWIAVEPGRGCYMASEDEISNWRVVYEPRPPDTDKPEGGVSYGC